MNAQTEARVMLDPDVEWFHPDEVVKLIVTALAAKDAELAVQREAKEHARRECDRAEAQLAAYRQSAVHPDDHGKALVQLAEARKALEEIIENDRAELKILEYGRTYTQEHDGPFAKIARRALEA